MTKTKEFKRLFFDIETSPNVVYSWNIGHKLNISHDSIIKERAIICICYKWEGEKTVNYLTWNKGDDKTMLVKFAKIMNSADDIVGHNGDNFDVKWVRGRCLYHGIPLIPDFKTIDTLKLSRKQFRLNSNKLDYIAKYLGLGGKIKHGGFDMWREIMEHNDPKAMIKMVDYCKKDVTLLEQVYNKLRPYILATTHVGILKDKDACTCPNCASNHVISNGRRITASGTIKKRLHCQDCGQYFSVNNNTYDKLRN